MTRPISLQTTNTNDSLIFFATEAPDNLSSWKNFCKQEFDLEQLLSVFRQLTLGLMSMHEHNIIFRDLHPTRINLVNGIVKWNMIGMPYNFKKLLKSFAYTGHLNYTAPELLI